MSGERAEILTLLNQQLTSPVAPTVVDRKLPRMCGKERGRLKSPRLSTMESSQLRFRYRLGRLAIFPGGRSVLPIANDDQRAIVPRGIVLLVQFDRFARGRVFACGPIRFLPEPGDVG